MGGWNIGYRLTTNEYKSLVTDESANTGVILNGTLQMQNYSGGRVYDNTFDDIGIATQTEENNQAAQITCNTYQNGWMDWAINPQTGGYLADQGTECPNPTPGATNGTRAGNEFISNELDENIYEFELNDQFIYYSAGGINANTIPSSPITDLAEENNCDMQVTDPSCDPIIIILGDWDVLRRTNQGLWSGKLADLDTLENDIDGGETQLMKDTIANLSTNDTTLRTVLAAYSPLSNQVLDDYIYRDTTVTPLNFQAVMLKNLPATKEVWESVLDKLVGKKDDWLAVADTLKWGQISNPGIETSTSLNREIRYHAGRTHLYANDVVNYYLDGDSIDEAMAYMDTVGLLSHRIALLGTYIGDSNWDEADSSLAMLPLKTVDDTATFDLFSILIDLGRDTLTILNMSSLDSTRVQQIAADTTIDASTIAKGMLSVLLDTFYFEIPETVPESPSGKWAGEEVTGEEMIVPTEASYFNVYPNPFSNYTTIEYDLGKECELGCELRLFDLQGRIILQQTLLSENGKGRINVDMNRYSNGVYYCALYGNKQMLQTEKLILMK